MLIIFDQKIPKAAQQKLGKIGELFPFTSQGIVYPAISGHPDIFIFQYEQQLILAPQISISLIKKLKENNINFNFGNQNLGNLHPLTTPYNVAYRNDLFIGNSEFADSSILELAEHYVWIESTQAYARCNSLILDKAHIITSEISVAQKLDFSLLVSAKPILLEGFANGFFGGCAGILDSRIFLIGSLKYHPQGDEISAYCRLAGYEIIELYDGPLFDGGGIFFIE